MIHRPSSSNSFEFVRLASLRAAQLMRGCTPRVPGTHRPILMAQMEVGAGKILSLRADGGADPIPYVRPDLEPMPVRERAVAAAGRRSGG